MISGFFFKSSLKNDPKVFIIKKSIQLLLPWGIWCILRGSLLVLYSIFYKNANFDIMQIVKIVFGGHFWFLRELFISCVVVYIGYKILKKGYTVALLCICFAMFAPLMTSQSFYLPIFFVGIFMKEYYKQLEKYTNIIMIVSVVIFGICLSFWKGEYYDVFLKIFSFKKFEFSFSNIPDGIYRLLTGISGSIFFFIFFKKVYKENITSKCLSNYGQYTLEIYILQVIIIETILTKIIDFGNINTWIYSLVITPIIAICVFVMCIIIIKIIQKNKIINLLLFGRK
jgi:fucose 4-O-acetylase-like acetyltransferase